MQTRYYYGHAVDFYPVISTVNTVQIFIPEFFSWEEGAKKAEIILDSKHSIQANISSKIIMLKGGKHIKEIEIPFEYGPGGEPKAVITDILKKEGIEYNHGDGEGCDGLEWTQEDYTSEIIYCKDGSLEHISSPYWGEQYQFNFTNKKLRPIAGGKAMKGLRFNNCKSGVWVQMEILFRRFMEERIYLEHHDLSWLSREMSEAGHMDLVALVKGRTEYTWEYI